MKIKKSSFVISAVAPSQYPEDGLPEIAFAGRSNVGKSSLINMLLNRKGLAKTSSTPGKTQTVNFYDLDSIVRFVDLPGYGFAKVSKTQKASWGKIIETYLSTRQNLLEVIQLIDIRHKPTKEDKEMYSWIRSFGFSGIVVTTKADKLGKTQLQKQLKVIRKELNMEDDAIIIPISSTSRKGKYQVWDLFNAIYEANGFDIYFERQVNDPRTTASAEKSDADIKSQNTESIDEAEELTSSDESISTDKADSESPALDDKLNDKIKQEDDMSQYPVVTITLKSGQVIKAELYPEVAPITVNNFVSLVQKGFYDGLIFHRVINGFMLQGGCPDGTGMGGPGYGIKGEFRMNGVENNLKHTEGVLSMARSQHPDSAGSQFFIMHKTSPHLDGQYAAFGKVTEGMDIVNEIAEMDTNPMDRPLQDVVMEKVTVDLNGYEAE